MKGGLFIGLMTGTSVDAIDAALCRFDDTGITLINAINAPLTAALQSNIRSLFEPGNNEIELLGRLDITLAEAYANAVETLIQCSNVNRDQITAIGCHGQTLRHRPPRRDQETAFTLQIGDPNTLATLTGVPVVADFRRKDLTLGGEGAPLAPGFHHYLARAEVKPLGVLNIGGIANLSVISASEPELIGFDTGPGNALLDYWVTKYRGEKHDDKGAWAAQGTVNPDLLAHFLHHPYFKMPPPKSTGKEEFSTRWLEQVLADFNANNICDVDIQATLLELSAVSIAEQVRFYSPLQSLYLCGGGIHNDFLIARLRAHLPQLDIKSTQTLGVHPDWIEACAFAWLAKKRVDHETGNIPAVTGAKRSAILGGLWLP